MDVPQLHAGSWRRLAVREDVNQHPEWGSDQTTAGSTTASEGGEVAREEEDQHVRDLETTEPEDRLFGHFLGSSEWKVADLPQLIGGLYYIPAYSELWLIRFAVGDQLRHAHTLYLTDSLRPGVTPSLLLVRAVA